MPSRPSDGLRAQDPRRYRPARTNRRAAAALAVGVAIVVLILLAFG